MSMFIGEAVVGDGNEIAHIDLLIGDKEGPVGTAFANALARQSEGHSNLLAVLTPNLAVKPATVMITKDYSSGDREMNNLLDQAYITLSQVTNKKNSIRLYLLQNLLVFLNPGSMKISSYCDISNCQNLITDKTLYCPK